MNDIVWHHMCEREITSYKSPLRERKVYQEMAQAGTPPITPPEAPKPVYVWPKCYAKLQNLTHKPELNGSEVVVEGPSAVPGRVTVRLPMDGSRKFLVDPTRLVPIDADVPVRTYPQEGNAIQGGKLSKAKSTGDIIRDDRQVNIWKRNLRDAMEAGPMAVPQKGLKALFAEPTGVRSPSVVSARSTSSALPPKSMYLPPFPRGFKASFCNPALPEQELGTACVPLRDRPGHEEPWISLSARKSRKGYYRNGHGAFWRRLT